MSLLITIAEVIVVVPILVVHAFNRVSRRSRLLFTGIGAAFQAAFLILSPDTWPVVAVSGFVIVLVIDRKWFHEVREDELWRSEQGLTPLTRTMKGYHQVLGPVYDPVYRRRLFRDRQSREHLEEMSIDLKGLFMIEGVGVLVGGSVAG